MDRKKKVAKLQRDVSKWLREWVVNPTMIRSFRDEPPALFDSYLEGKEDGVLIRRRAQKIQIWHLIHAEHEVLNEGGDGRAHLALAVRHAEAYVHFEAAYANAGRGGLGFLLTNAALYFSLAVMAGWKDSAIRIGNTLVRGLDTSLLDLRHTDQHQAGTLFRHFWFVMHLYTLSGGPKFDTSLYSYPEDMSPYAAALQDWRTSDLNKVHDWVCAMADFHILQTRYADEEIHEFDNDDVNLLPYEILCWLRLREWAGLANPEAFDHPLMQQPLARLLTPVPLEVPATPLLDQVIARFREEFPGSFAQWPTAR